MCLPVYGIPWRLGQCLQSEALGRRSAQGTPIAVGWRSHSRRFKPWNQFPVTAAQVRGATAHFDAVVGGATSGVLSAGLDSGVPVIFCVMTTDTMEQVRSSSRSSGNLCEMEGVQQIQEFFIGMQEAQRLNTRCETEVKRGEGGRLVRHRITSRWGVSYR